MENDSLASMLDQLANERLKQMILSNPVDKEKWSKVRIRPALVKGALIPEAVIIAAVSVKINMKPILIRRIPAFLLHIFKCPESTAYMIKYTVQNNLHIMFVEILTNLCKISVRAKAAVDRTEISRIVAMII